MTPGIAGVLRLLQMSFLQTCCQNLCCRCTDGRQARVEATRGRNHPPARRSAVTATQLPAIEMQKRSRDTPAPWSAGSTAPPAPAAGPPPAVAPPACPAAPAAPRASAWSPAAAAVHDLSAPGNLTDPFGSQEACCSVAWPPRSPCSSACARMVSCGGSTRGLAVMS